MSDLLSAYIAGSDQKSRTEVLVKMKESGQSLPIVLTEDLLSINLDADEKWRLLELTASPDKLELEHFLTQGIRGWDQNLAAVALRKWARESHHLLWFRLLSFMNSPILAQRIRYTILDLCHFVFGKHLLKIILASEGVEDLSPAFHGLLLHRSLQWSFHAAELDRIAEHCLSELDSSLWPDHKALPAAIAWFHRFKPGWLENKIHDFTVPGVWREHLKLICQHHPIQRREESRLIKFLRAPSGDLWKGFSELWPGLSLRCGLSVEAVSVGLQFMYEQRSELPWPEEERWELFAGIAEERLVESLLVLADPMSFAYSIRLLQGLLPVPPDMRLVESAKKHLASGAEPSSYLAALSLRFRLAFHEGSAAGGKGGDKHQKVLDDERRHIQEGYRSDLPIVSYGSLTSSARATLASDEEARREFFDLAYRHKKIVPMRVKDDNFWALLSKNWHRPHEEDLPRLAMHARQAPDIFQTCYIHTLARFEKKDPAVLKLLDFIRTTNENLMQEVIQALGGIGTPRALQELLAAITRPNVTPQLQLEICQILHNKDLKSLQGELRSAIDDLHQGKVSEPAASDIHEEVKEALTALLSAVNEATPAAKPRAHPLSERSEPASGQALDEILIRKIPHYDELSSEVRRALRTALFFYQQVEKADTAHAIDLSPVIDMQYKALELIFRESFEEPCAKLVNQGVLQRKLDVIGYARPIPKAMDDFEHYIGSLPVIKDIPYFSKFKLRKMLRAICQFRPGRRFTLDGIKAFALFFLCFARKKCTYGLAGIVPLALPDDLELAEFCKTLHVFQDFRNRAAHEGFRPEARNDMDGIWQATASIITVVYQIKDPLMTALLPGLQPRRST